MRVGVAGLFCLTSGNHFLCLLSSMASDDDFDMSRYSSSGYSSAEVRPHTSRPTHTRAGQPASRRRDGAKSHLRGAMDKARQSGWGGGN